jgi:hypothetical protein
MYVVASHCVMVMEQIIAHIVYGCKIEAVFFPFLSRLAPISGKLCMSGLQDFSLQYSTKRVKIYQLTSTYTKWP